uniref:SFRICE_009906 n=1 Tax=Spodoptera frugiperda TaxID=7108 RepID=A0A2H1VLX4_SPOFR
MVSVHRPASHATDFGLSCIETHTTASTDPHRTDRIISNAYMRCVLMTSYGMPYLRNCLSRKSTSSKPASHATDFSLSCVKTHTTASTDPNRTDRIIGNAYMRCVLMTSYAMRTMRLCRRLPQLRDVLPTVDRHIFRASPPQPPIPLQLLCTRIYSRYNHGNMNECVGSRNEINQKILLESILELPTSQSQDNHSC